MHESLAFLESMKTLIGTPVRLNIYIPPDAVAVYEDAHVIWQGKIVEIRGQLLRFEHDEITREEIGVSESLLNLQACIIWAVDIAKERMK